jgi:hypothetical protein
MYYKIKTISSNGTQSFYRKEKHVRSMEIINALLVDYGFTKPITKNTFNNILTRPSTLPDRIKWLINTGKLIIERAGLLPANLDVLAHIIGSVAGNIQESVRDDNFYHGISREMYGPEN